MLEVYFDGVLIDVEAYTELDNEYKLFTDTFKLGSVASNTFKLSVLKTAVNSQPYNVRIEDDDTVMNFVVDNVTEDDYVYAYTLTDKLLNFNFEYDASGIINLKEQEEEECYLSDIWHDMCLQAGVEYDDTYVFENDIVVNWYDNRIQARRYLSYIAELQSGYACILENGKQSFKKQKRSSVKTIDADECSDLIIGEKKTITRVVYDSGAFKWEYGDFEGNTLYLQSDNVFIVNEEIVENIYNNIKDFEFYILDVPQAPMDSSIKAGDVITINDNGVMYPTIAQYTMSYAGGWTGGYKIAVNTDRQQETQIIKDKENIRNLNVKVDRLNNDFEIVVEQTDENSIQLNQLTMTVDKVEQTVRTTGGSNQIKDSVGFFGLDESLWIKEGNVSGGYDQSLVGRSISASKITIQNGSIRSAYNNIENLLLNSTYTLSFKVINPSDTTLKVKLINSVEVVNLEVNSIKNLEEYEFSFVVKSDRAYIEMESESLYSGSSSIVDLMLNSGNKKTWELAKDEMNGATMQTSSIGTIFRNINADTATLVNSDGFDVRGYRNNQIGDVITKLGKDGVDTNIVKCTEIKRQKLIQKTINSNGREIYIEYIEGS